MTDEQASFPEIQPPPVDVARPDIAPPAKDSLGRSMANKRGRKPKDPSAPPQIQAKQIQAEVSKRLPANSILSDENVGKAIAGAFGAIGIFRGGHWRLFSTEEKEFGECFGPLARLYGPEELGKWITLLMVLPVVTGVLGPRLAVEKMIMSKAINRDQGRLTLLQIKGMVEAEKQLNLEVQVKEGAEYLKAQAGIGMSVAAMMKKEELEKEQIILNGVAAEPETNA